MQRASKKVRERYWCERLKQLLPDFPEGQIDPCGENPDLRVNSPRGIIGIEVTEVCEPLEEEQLSLRSRVLSRAQKLYEAVDHPPVRVSVLFSTHEPIRVPQVDFLAERLCEIVIRNLPPGFGAAQEWYDWRNRSHFPIQFDAVSIYRLPELSRNSWSFSSSVYIPTRGATEIQEIIDRKESRVATYRKTCSSVWLVIAVDGFRSSSIATLAANAGDHSFKTPFDRAFILNDRHELVELKTHP